MAIILRSYFFNPDFCRRFKDNILEFFAESDTINFYNSITNPLEKETVSLHLKILKLKTTLFLLQEIQVLYEKPLSKNQAMRLQNLAIINKEYEPIINKSLEVFYQNKELKL